MCLVYSVLCVVPELYHLVFLLCLLDAYIYCIILSANTVHLVRMIVIIMMMTVIMIVMNDD